jgi:tRNA pseudouridine55 synthase
VTIEAIEVVEVSLRDAVIDVRVDLRCGPGTYVRSLARDLGDRLGVGGHLHALRRTEAAGLRVDDSVTPEELEAAADEGRFTDHLLAVGALLPLPAVVLDADAAWKFVHGSIQSAPPGTPEGRVKVFDASDQLLGVGVAADAMLRPEKVVASELAS